MHAEPSARTVLFAELAEGCVLARPLLERVFEALGEAVQEAGGRVAERLGDELLCTFADPRDALQAAIDTQDRSLELRAAEPGAATLALRVGFHHGDVVLDGERVSGAAVYRAKRVAEAARPGQILVTEEILPRLAGAEIPVRYVDTLTFKGQTQATRLHEVVWNAPDATTVRPYRLPEPRGPQALVLEHAGSARQVEPGERLVIGRAPSAGLRVDEEGVSRQHTTIESERGRYVLRDSSTNGTFVLRDGERRPIFVRRDELRLVDEGLVGLGAPPEEGRPYTLRYRHEDL